MMNGVMEDLALGKGDFVLLDDLTEDAFMDNLKLRYVINDWKAVVDVNGILVAD